MFLSSGIRELDLLMTRHEGRAIPLPDRMNGPPSSTLVIKGRTGTGKTALAAILAHNLHLRPEGDNLVLPVFFSFAQPAAGIRAYVQGILGAGEPDPPSLPLDSRGMPVVVAPRSPRSLRDEGGLRFLQRALLRALMPLRPEPAAFAARERADWEEIHARLQAFGEGLGAEWDFDRLQRDAMMDSVRRVRCGNSAEAANRIRPLVIVDPLNWFFDFGDSRAVVAELLSTFRSWEVPLVLVLEDAGEDAPGAHRGLASAAEFEADAILELSTSEVGHFRRTIQVRKSRNAQPIFGRHMYRIEKEEHSLAAVAFGWKGRHPGFLIFRSIHWYLSQFLDRRHVGPARNVPLPSGIHALDRVLLIGEADGDAGPKPQGAIPPDAFILVRGERGGHKLSLAFNLLIAGLWAENEEKRNVLLLSLGEETSIQIDRIALACSAVAPRAPRSGDNVQRIARVFRPGGGSGGTQTPGDGITSVRDEVGPKVNVNQWHWEAPGDPGGRPGIIEVTFKPGHLSPEEFLWIVDSLAVEYKPSRILLANTAHLHMRFPELCSETMLFPGLTSITRRRNAVLIVIHVGGAGADKELDHGLAACADYILEAEHDPKLAAGTAPSDPSQGGGRGQIWSRLEVRNVRGKVYREVPHPFTVLTCPSGEPCSRPRGEKKDVLWMGSPQTRSECPCQQGAGHGDP